MLDNLKKLGGFIVQNKFKVIINSNLIDCVKKGLRKDIAVILKGNKIDKIVPKTEVDLSSDKYEIIDAEGRYLMPGLIDTHVHVFHPGFVPKAPAGDKTAYAGVVALKNLKTTLQSGVTTVRDVSSGYVNVALKTAINRNLFKGPRLYAAGRGICMTGGHGTEMEDPYGSNVIQADGEVEIRKAIRKEINSGADLIKILTSHTQEYPEYTQEELNIAVEEAHRFGKRVACHAGNAVTTRMATIAGVDTIEHGIDIDEETAKMMEEKNITLVPTLWVLHDIKEKTEERQNKYKKINEYELHQESFESTLNRYEKIMARIPKTMEIINKYNINIATGTDNIRWYRPFAMLHEEIYFLTQYGLSNMEAIIAATKGGAKAIGVEDQIGTIEPGKYADLIMVENNPLEDIKVLKDINWVMKDGEIIEQSSEWNRYKQR